MLDQFIERCDTVRRLRSGVFGAHLDSFAEYLATCGYAAATARSQLTLLGHFDQWMARRRRGLGELNDELVGQFVQHRTRLGQLRRGESVAVHQFLTHLRARGVVASPAPMVDDSPLGQLQRHYEQHLRAERGLAPATVTKYRGVFRWFLTDRFGDGPLDLRALDVAVGWYWSVKDRWGTGQELPIVEWFLDGYSARERLTASDTFCTASLCPTTRRSSSASMRDNFSASSSSMRETGMPVHFATTLAMSLSVISSFKMRRVDCNFFNRFCFCSNSRSSDGISP